MGVSDGELSGLIAQARRAAQKRGQRASTGHVLLVMFQGGGELGALMAKRGVGESALLSALKVVDDEPASALEVALERAHRLARVLGEKQVRPIHLLLALARDGRTVAYRCLEQMGTGAATVAELAMGTLGLSEGKARIRMPRTQPQAAPETSVSPVRNPVKSQTRAAPQANPDAPANVPEKPRAAARARVRTDNPYELDRDRFPLLSKLGRNLSLEASHNKLEAVVGRERELERVLDVLARRHANNPLLCGPSGVGKTAIVESLATRIVGGGEGLEGLAGRIVIELSPGGLLVGTGVRGAVVERIRQLRMEVRRADGRVLLFIDEIHASLSGGGSGADDLAGEIKLALGRGEMVRIGATTEAEYRRHFERDPALVRRFSKIAVEEPTPAQALAVLHGVRHQYEAHHGVRLTEEALETAVDLSVRYLPERHLPEKALSVIDLAAARVRRRGGQTVSIEAVSSVISEQVGIPLERLTVRDGERLLRLEEELSKRIVGHEEMISRIAHVLRKSMAGLRGKRPLGSFLLLGPTGVGKTETAKAVCDAVFPAGAMTRLDMSEYSESHAVAKLFGAPPGYIGHEDGGLLTEAVRRRPYQLLLLDEIEKAHPEVLLALLPMLDEGRLTDSHGRTIDFTNTIVFMTSNLGADAALATSRIGFEGEGKPEARTDAVLASARRALPPEFWNRIDEHLVFGALTVVQVMAIARRLLDGLAATLLSEKGIELHVTDEALHVLAECGGYEPTLGARPMRRTISRCIEAKIAEAILAGSVPKGTVIRVLSERGEVTVEFGERTEAAE